METTQELMRYCRLQRPILDIQGKFMFFSNNKVAQTSINRRAMRDRCIVYKDNNNAYDAYYATIDEDMFKSMYKFTIVRNPWSRVVSAFFYLLNKSHRVKRYTFQTFVSNILATIGPAFDPHFDFQYPKAFFKGYCFLDYIGKIENLEHDWAVITKHIDGPHKLPHLNKSKHRLYTTYYNNKTKEIIYNLYKKDIDAFGYTFGD